MMRFAKVVLKYFMTYFMQGKDRNHHGPVPDDFMPDSENMKTIMIGNGPMMKRLNQLHQDVEMNLRLKICLF